MIIVTLIGGLGNQLFQYVLAKQISARNKVPLKLDLSTYKSDKLRDYKLDRYNISAAIATHDEVERFSGLYRNNSILNKVRRKIRNLKPRHQRSYLKEEQYYLYEPAVEKISKNILLEGFWQHHKYFENVPSEILAEITLKNEYILAKPQIISQIEQDPGSVSIHIRRGDYVNDPENLNFFGVLPIDYYLNAINFLNGRKAGLNYYVFSNDLDWAKDNLKIKSPLTFVDINEGKTEFIELDAMSKCRHNIIANSSFSWWGGFLNKNPEKIVVAPDKWVVIEELNKKVSIQVPSWTQL